jgi:hypothetical protein
MLKTTILASALALSLAVPARAGEVERIDRTTHRLTTALPDDVVEVRASRPNPVGTIVGDAIGGAIVGGAIGGGVALYNRYGTNGGNGDWGNWQRDILVGAGIGLGVGLIVGGISAASQAADHSYLAPATEHRDVGFSAPLGNYGVPF